MKEGLGKQLLQKSHRGGGAPGSPVQAGLKENSRLSQNCEQATKKPSLLRCKIVES